MAGELPRLPSQYGMRVAANCAWTASDIERCLSAVLEDATLGQPQFDQRGNLLGHRRVAAAQKLVLAYGLGAPPKSPAPYSIDGVDADALGTLDGCLEALGQIFEAQNAGQLEAEQASALRSTVESAMRLHTARAGGDEALALAEAGAEAIYLDASDPSASLREFAELLDEEGDHVPE